MSIYYILFETLLTEVFYRTILCGYFRNIILSHTYTGYTVYKYILIELQLLNI